MPANPLVCGPVAAGNDNANHGIAPLAITTAAAMARIELMLLIVPYYLQSLILMQIFPAPVQ